MLPTFDDFPQPGQPNTIYIEEEFDVAYYWDGEIYREFTSSGDLIVIRKMDDLDQYATAGLFRVKFITRTRTRPARTVVENFVLNVTKKPTAGSVSQSFEKRLPIKTDPLLPGTGKTLYSFQKMTRPLKVRFLILTFYNIIYLTNH